MKVYMYLLDGVEQIKQVKQEVTIFVSEEVTKTIEVAVKNSSTSAVNLAGMYKPGMEGSRLKIVINNKDVNRTTQWLHYIVLEMIKGSLAGKRDKENSVK